MMVFETPGVLLTSPQHVETFAVRNIVTPPPPTSRHTAHCTVDSNTQQSICYIVYCSTSTPIMTTTGGCQLNYDILTKNTRVYEQLFQLHIKYLLRSRPSLVATLISDKCEISNPTLWPARVSLSPCPDSTRHCQGETKISQEEEEKELLCTYIAHIIIIVTGKSRINVITQLSSV